jgi:archaemetzincin
MNGISAGSGKPARPACLFVALILSGACTMAFEQPGPEDRRAAIGATEGLPAALRRALAPDADFEPVPAPGPHDWLAVHREAGQTFDDFRRGQPNRPDASRRLLYLQPLGDFPEQRSPPLSTLREFAETFFQMEAKALAPVSLSAGRFTSRTNRATARRQILADDVLRFLKARLPGEAFCLLAITMEDLYPEPSWNFVFGQASLRERVGLYSFARYDPAFYGEPRGKDYQAVLLRRSLKVLAHETAHMFGLTHCIYFNCLMNGSNHLPESDRRPLHLCPVCLRKLQFSVGFDVVKRYEALAQFYRRAGIDDEAGWVARRLEKILDRPPGQGRESP